MEVKLDVKDALALDDRAFTVIGKPRRDQVLVVSAGNRYLADNFRTSIVQQIADVREATPEEFKGADVAQDVAAGRYDLIVFDGVRPEKDPAANTLYIGVMPPGKAFDKTRPMETPIIVLNYDSGHPLLQYVRDLPTIEILKATTLLDPPAGLARLVESNDGLLAFSVPREGFTDVALTFPIIEGSNINTNWPVKYSFPLFFANCLRILGNSIESAGEDVDRPGRPIALRADSATQSLTVEPPPTSSRRSEKIRRGAPRSVHLQRCRRPRFISRQVGQGRADRRGQSVRSPRKRLVEPAQNRGRQHADRRRSPRSRSADRSLENRRARRSLGRAF